MPSQPSRMASRNVNFLDDSRVAAPPASEEEELFFWWDGDSFNTCNSLLLDRSFATATEEGYHVPESVASETFSAPDSLPGSLDQPFGSWEEFSFPSFSTDATSPLSPPNQVRADTYGSFNSFPFSDSFSPGQTLSSPTVDFFTGCADPPVFTEPLPEEEALGVPIPYASIQGGRKHYVSLLTHDVPPVLSVSPPVAPSPKLQTPSFRNRSRSDPRTNTGDLISPVTRANGNSWIHYQASGKEGKLVASGQSGNSGRRPRGRKHGLNPAQRKDAHLMRMIKACSNCRKRKEKCDPGTPCRACLDHYKGGLIYHPCREKVLPDLCKIFLSERLGWHPTSRSLPAFLGNTPHDIMSNLAITIPIVVGFGPSLYLPTFPIRIHDTKQLIHKHVVYPWPPSAAMGTLHNHAVLPAVVTPEAVVTLQATLDSHLSHLVRDHFRAFPLPSSQLSILKAVYVLYRSLPHTSVTARLLHQALKLLVLVHIGGDITLPYPSSDPRLVQLLRTTDVDEEITPTPCFIRSQFGQVMPQLAMSLMKDVLTMLEKLCLSRSCAEWSGVLAAFAIMLMTVESIQYHAAKVSYHAVYDTNASAASSSFGSAGSSSAAGSFPASLETTELGAKARDTRILDDQGVDTLIGFYKACFSGCHARLRQDWGGDPDPDTDPNSGSRAAVSPEDRFVDAVRESMKVAGKSGYLRERAKAGAGIVMKGVDKEEKEKDKDMKWYFDRLLARLLVLNERYE